MRFFGEEEVRQRLPMADAVQLMRRAFEGLASGSAVNHPRRRVARDTGAVLHYMAGAEGKYMGSKIYATHPVGGAHFLFLLFDASEGQPLAVFEANWLGQIRTGAVSGLATDLLARPDARTLGLIGSGFQARSQLEAIRSVRKIQRVRVWSRSAEMRRAFAGEMDAEAVETAAEAVEGADIVVTATSARDPVVEDRWIGPGAHINAVGSNQARRRELTSELVRRADLVVVDSLEQARMESGDLLLGLDDWSGVRELAEVVTGRVGRTATGHVTLFKSNGLAVEDVAAASYVYEQARQDHS